MWVNSSIINPQQHKAFVYKITNLDTNQLYIGYKQLYTRRYNNRLKRYITKESDWQTYQSSSPEVQSWINIRKEILYACSTPAEARYIETRLLFMVDALNPQSPYVNKNIAGKYFRYYPM